MGLIRQKGRLLLLCNEKKKTKNIKPAELQQPEGVMSDGEVWMEKFCVCVLGRGGREGGVAEV